MLAQSARIVALVAFLVCTAAGCNMQRAAAKNPSLTNRPALCYTTFCLKIKIARKTACTAEYYENINHFLVGLFNDILKIEGKALRAGEYREISMRDMHIIEAICAASGQEDNRTTAIARELDITTGTLTVAVNSLVKKGYVERRKDQRDRRVVRLYPTVKSTAGQRGPCQVPPRHGGRRDAGAKARGIGRAHPCIGCCAPLF